MNTFNVGDILSNNLRQFAKIVAIKQNGLYGLSGWTTVLAIAQEATTPAMFLNKNGLMASGLSVVGGEEEAEEVKPKLRKPRAKKNNS